VPAGLRLRTLLAGGDRLQRAPRRSLPFALVNGYGPTESSVIATWETTEPLSARTPAIGRPVDGTRVYVVDAGLDPVPAGVPGELLLGGAGLARGYLGRPELTAARFIPDPFSCSPGREGGRLYRTGDRVRWLADGSLDFLGRVDHQVKIRGYRVEPAEIESALLRHPDVREAAVLAREDAPGEKRLVGYIVPSRQPAPAAAELREFLQETLPEYMVPWSFVALAALPVTGNGKLDREALPAPPEAGTGTAFVAPRNDLERAIAAAWRDVLRLDRVGVRESFFEVGGSSLLLARLQSRLRQALGREIPFVELFRHPTIESLARSLEGEAPRPEERAEQARARTETRRESMRQLQERRKSRR
jgi:aryl carrier-like protein